MKPGFITKETVLDTDIKDRKFPEFRVGDTIQVGQIIKEGEKERIQMFKGDVIAVHNNGIASTFTVRRIGADNVGVEKIFPYYSPIISEIEVLKKGNVRRAKLFYVREKVGKEAKIKEKMMVRRDEELGAIQAAVPNAQSSAVQENKKTE